MTRHFQIELEKLKKKILSLGGMVEEQVRMAIRAIENRDGELAEKIIAADHKVDETEVEVEEECLKVLALHQPVAVDLRFITALIKINNDLERIGDEAVNISQRVANIARRAPMKVPINYGTMTAKSEAMLKKSLDALVNLDVDLAYKVCFADDEVDEINKQNYDKLKESIRQHPEHVGYLINFLLVSRHLERIADHATNIAEDVIYLVTGEIARHGKQ
jgi:phosphate transport system protein